MSSDERKCLICGKVFLFEGRRSRKKYCSAECSKVVKDKAKREYYRQNKEVLNAKCTMRRKEKKAASSNMKDIVDIAVAARQAGMTYGQYVALHGL